MFIFLWVSIQQQEIAPKQNFINLSMKKQDFYLIDRLKDMVVNILPINSFCYNICLFLFVFFLNTSNQHDQNLNLRQL